MTSNIHRRSLLLGAGSIAVAAEERRTTYVYKTVGSLQVRADVYRPSDDSIRPVLVWIHGGALINGHREGIATQVKQWASVAGYVLVSIDYRLAPETQLPEIIRDVEDAFTWVRQEGPRLFRANPARIAVAGGSAGGYLTLTAGFRVRPRPAVLLALWGYGDLIGNWYSKPSPHARHTPSRCPGRKPIVRSGAPPFPIRASAKATAALSISTAGSSALGLKQYRVGTPSVSRRNSILTCL